MRFICEPRHVIHFTNRLDKFLVLKYSAQLYDLLQLIEIKTPVEAKNQNQTEAISHFKMCECILYNSTTRQYFTA